MEESSKKDLWIEIKKVAEESTYGIGLLSRLKYHWEFLRRNPKYIETYNKFKDSFNDPPADLEIIKTEFPMIPSI